MAEQDFDLSEFLLIPRHTEIIYETPQVLNILCSSNWQIRNNYTIYGQTGIFETNLTDKLLDSLGKEKRRSDQRKDAMKPTSAVILC